jgi:branched-chain amino acid transport system substrate-binding protein
VSVPMRCTVMAIMLAFACAGAQPKPYRDLSNAGATFHQSISPHVNPDTISAFRIGVLAPIGSPDGTALIRGVKLGVEIANTEGGLSLADGRAVPFEVVVRDSEGPWGVAASQTSAFAYDDETWAAIVGLTGQQAHLAELISAKAWLPILVPWATDRSIDYANVPWVFRMAPDDAVQADSLADYAVRCGYDRIVVAVEDSRIGRTARTRVVDKFQSRGVEVTRVLDFRPNDVLAAAEWSVEEHPEAVVAWGSAPGTLAFAKALRNFGFDGAILASSSLVELEAEDVYPEGVVAAAPFDIGGGTEQYTTFSLQYGDRYGERSTPIAAMAYDATMMLVQAARLGAASATLTRASIRHEVARMQYEGATGHYRFNELGGVYRTPTLVETTESGWQKIGR